MSIFTRSQSLSFLHGGGEMGKLICSHDWENTPVGDIAEWPQSLRTTLSIIVKSKFPMFLWWGEELICFYNDAYRPSLGNEGKHPAILGMPAKDAWPEIWDIIKPLIDQVMQGGESTWSEDQLIPIFRNGKLEDVYWTFSYSPVIDESEKVAGVLVTCTETTDKVLGLKKIEASEKNFRNLVNTAPVPAALYRGMDMVIELANEELLKLWGKNESIIGKKLLEAMPELTDQPFIQLLQQVYTTGITYEGREVMAWMNKDGKTEHVYFNLVYKAVKDSEGKIDGILAMGFDVTEQIVSRKRIEELEERTRLAVDSAMLGTFDFNMITDEIICSKRLCEIFGFDNTNVTHAEFVNAIHPDDLPVRNAAFKEAGQTGAIAYEARIIWPDQSIHWIKTQGKVFMTENKKPFRILGIVSDITQEKQFVAQLEASERKFRNTVVQAPVGIIILRGKDFIVEMANETYLEVVDRKEKDFVGKSLFESLPEVRTAVEPLLNDVLKTGVPYFGNEFEVFINRYGKKESSFFNFVYQPLYENDGSINAIIVVVNEITKLVEAKHRIQESEKKFSQIYMQSPIAMTALRGEDLIIESANTELLDNIWRKKSHEVIGKSILEVFPELKEQKYPELLKNVFRTGVIHREKESVAYVAGNDGMKKFYLDFEYSPLHSQDGKVSGIMITVYDVTEKVISRKKIEESERKFRLLADSMPQHIWTGDTDGNLNYFNQSVYDFSGLTQEQVEKEGWLQIVHPDDRENNVAAWTKTITTGESFLFEHRFRRHDGEYRWQLSRALPVKDSNGMIQMWVGTSTDIDEIKKHQQEKDDFIKIASHELKTPVTTIKAYVQLLLQQGFARQDVMLTKSLSTIDKQITKLAKLISDLLDVTKIETGSFQPSKEAFSVAELIRDVAANIQATTHTHRILFHESVDILLNADKDRITQVLGNLLTNAIKYSPDGDKVIINVRTEGNAVVVAIQDFGIGMTYKDHDKIFERFYRAENTTGKIFPGFGIGLFIVKEIISQHKGKVWVESEPNKGSTFYFSLPL